MGARNGSISGRCYQSYLTPPCVLLSSPDPLPVHVHIALCILDSPPQYPGSFDIKVIGVDDDTFVSDIRKAVAGCLTNGEDSVVKCSTREKGKYTSITIKVRVENSSQLYKVNPVLPFPFFSRVVLSSV